MAATGGSEWGRLLVVAGRQVGRRVELVAREQGLTGGQWWLLSELAEPGADGRTLSELARSGGFASSTATVASDALAVSGLVRRDRDPDNRRLVRVWITEAGRELAAAIWFESDRDIGEPPVTGEPAERQQLTAWLARVGDRTPTG